MKIRVGFVSNSSSTTYMILLPKGFDVKAFLKEHEEVVPQIVEDELGMDVEEVSGPNLPEAFSILLSNGTLWDEESDFTIVLPILLKEYVIGAWDGASGDGKVVLADLDKVEKIMKPDSKVKRK